MLANKMKALASNAIETKLQNFINSEEYKNIIAGIKNEAMLGNYSYSLCLSRVNYVLVDALKRDGFVMNLEQMRATGGSIIFQLTIEWY